MSLSDDQDKTTETGARSLRGAPSVAFKPAWWLRGPHLQTLWAALVRSVETPLLRSECYALDDGDELELRWCGSEEGPLVVILHGLEGSSESIYVRALLQRIEARGWGGVVMQFRGCGSTINKLDRSYHSGDTADIRSLLKTLHTRYPGRTLFAVGYSLGGNVLLKYLGESAEETNIAAAAAVSVPFDLAAGANRLNRGFSRFYQRHLVRNLQRKVADKFAHRTAPIAIADLHRWKTFWLFDEHVTAPLHGFRSASEYYERSSCGQYLRHIVTPTLVIHAKDDPFLEHDAIPNDSELSPALEFELSNSGGHVGFVSGQIPFLAKYWLDARLMAWFGLNLEIGSQ